MKTNLLIAVLAVSCLAGGALYPKHEASAVQPQQIQAEKPLLPALFIPGPGRSIEHNPQFKVTASKEGLPSDMPVYRFKDLKIKKDRVQQTAAKVGMKGIVQENAKMNSFFVQDGEKLLEVEKDTGKIFYKNDKNYDKHEVGEVPKQIPSDEQASVYAVGFLKEMNWLPANFRVSGVTENRVIPGNLNPETDKGLVLNKTVHFNQYINNKPVLGVSRIMVEIGHNGEIEVVRKYHKEHENLQKYRVKSADEALVELKNNKGVHDIEEGGTDHEILSIDLTYWEDAGTLNEQPYMQPIYVFNGTYKIKDKAVSFTAVVPAVEDSLVIQPAVKQPAPQYHPEKAGK